MIVISGTEKVLAGAMKKRGLAYEQQKEIGDYTVDFLLRPKLIVEVDGPFHLSPERSRADIRRHKFLESVGYVVLRLPGREIRSDPRGTARLISMVQKNPEKYRMFPKSHIAFLDVIEYPYIVNY